MWRPSAKSLSTKSHAAPVKKLARRALALYVEQLLVRELRPLLDELEARFRLVAHQALDRAVGFLAFVIDHHDAQQRALLRVHGGLLELISHHLAEPLETADLDLGVGVEFLFHHLILVI